MKVIDFFDHGVRIARERICTVDVETGITSTYGDVQRATHQIANGLRFLGTKPGNTKVAVLSPNCGRAMTVVLGILRNGSVWVPVNARNSIGDNAYILDNHDTEVLCYHSDYTEQIAQFRQLCPKIKKFVALDVADKSADASVDGWLDEPYTPYPEYHCSDAGIMAIFGSGGTTGKPKGVMHSHRTWECLVMSLLTALPPKSGETVNLVAAPITHAAGAMAFPLLAVGATHLFIKSFDSKTVPALIQKYRVTHLYLPPTAIYMLLAEQNIREHDYSSIEYFVYASAPMSVEKLKLAMEVFGPVMVQTYGQTEAGPFVGTCFSAEEHRNAIARNPERLASCGQPTVMTKIKIIDDEGIEQPYGTRGEIAIGGDFQMMGYYKNEVATAEVQIDGWVHTGDIGYMDSDGYVYIVDRKREMIISGGFNVFPSEVEQAITMHPSVHDCAVIGVPDDKWGEAVKAIVVLKAGAKATEQEILSLCKERLGSVKSPKSVEFWSELPKSAVGKVVRRVVREKFWADQSRSV